MAVPRPATQRQLPGHYEPYSEAPQDKREKEIAKEKEIKKASTCLAYADSQRSSNH